MRVSVDPERFSQECAEYALRFCCEHCCYFIADAQSCAHFWPTAEHREANFSSATLSEVVFCKEFELS